jgi:hypothetical protein
MRKVTVLALVLGLVVLGSGLALAQNQISIGGSTNNVQFTGDGSGSPSTVHVTLLGSCGAAGACLSGSAFGTGTLTSGPAPWEILQNGASITLTFAGAGQWSVNQSGNLLFKYGTGGSLLSGDLQLLSFSQLAGDQLGNFNTQASINLTNLGGAFASTVWAGQPGARLTLTLLFPNTTNIASLLGTTNSLTAKVDHGAIHAGRVVPEPASMALFGVGLLSLGGMLRRRITG